MRNTRYQVSVVRVCTRLLAFVVDFVLHLGPLRDFFSANFTRTTSDQNATSPTYSTAQTGNHLRTSSYNHGPLIPAPLLLYVSVAFFLARA